MKLKGLGFAVVVLSMGCAGSQAATSAPEPGPEADAAAPAERAAVSKAMELYAAEDYEAAADAFADAYGEEPDTSLLFARAQSLRLAGQCDEARVLYDQFLAGSTDPTYHNAIQQLVDDCAEPSTPDGNGDSDTQVAAR